MGTVFHHPRVTECPICGQIYSVQVGHDCQVEDHGDVLIVYLVASIAVAAVLLIAWGCR